MFAWQSPSFSNTSTPKLQKIEETCKGHRLHQTGKFYPLSCSRKQVSKCIIQMQEKEKVKKEDGNKGANSKFGLL